MRDLKSCQVIASDKHNLLRKVDFLQKSGFHVIAFLFQGRTPCYNYHKLCLRMRTTAVFGTSQNDVSLVYIFGYFSWLLF